MKPSLLNIVILKTKQGSITRLLDIIEHAYEVVESPEDINTFKEDFFSLYIHSDQKTYAQFEKLDNHIFWSEESHDISFLSQFIKSCLEVEKRIWNSANKTFESLSESLASKEELSSESKEKFLKFHNNILMYNGKKSLFSLLSEGLEPLKTKDGKSLIFLDNNSNPSKYISWKFFEEDFTLIAHIYLHFLKNSSLLLKRKRYQESLEILEEFFNNLQEPIAILNNFYDLIVSNKAFRKLGILPSQCRKFDTGEKYEAEGGVYSVVKIEGMRDSNKYIVYKFIKLSEIHESSLQNEELGVVTSSIAHELNNPIGGILAGTEVMLSVKDEVSEDLVLIEEIHNSAKKCRDLIKTFLGFTKTNYQEKEDTEIEDILEQALSLMRTRMVESNLKFQMKKDVLGDFSVSNQPLWTMILYIVFTNIFNFFSKEKLVHGNAINEIKLDINIRPNELKLGFDHDSTNVLNEVNNSAFFYHLLSQAKVHYQYQGMGVSFQK